MSPTSSDHTAGPDALEPGLRAARLRRGLSQEQAAALVNASLSSYRRWDRGGSPQDPGMAQAIAEALDTPIEVIWPPEDNPAAATALRAIRDQRAKDEAREAARPQDLEAHQQREAALAQTPANTGETDEIWTAPAVASAPASSHRVPNPLDLVATLDGKDALTPGAFRSNRRRRRFLVPAAASFAVVAAAGTAIATTGGDAPAPHVAPAAEVGPTPTERERAARRVALNEARQRGDYDEAITIAARLDDSAATTQLRQTAAALLARRARTAAERGDLPLATSRLDKAEERYGELSAVDAVRRRIEAIKDARKKRAAAARKRAAVRARAAAVGRARATAAVRRQTPAQQSASPSSSSHVTPAPVPTTRQPTPSPTPAPSPGAGGPKPGGGSSAGGAVDPGLY